jgi:hypothetical protein
MPLKSNYDKYLLSHRTKNIFEHCREVQTRKNYFRWQDFCHEKIYWWPFQSCLLKAYVSIIQRCAVILGWPSHRFLPPDGSMGWTKLRFDAERKDNLKEGGIKIKERWMDTMRMQLRFLDIYARKNYQNVLYGHTHTHITHTHTHTYITHTNISHTHIIHTHTLTSHTLTSHTHSTYTNMYICILHTAHVLYIHYTHIHTFYIY